jgi:hypothetical protein
LKVIEGIAFEGVTENQDKFINQKEKLLKNNNMSDV